VPDDDRDRKLVLTRAFISRAEVLEAAGLRDVTGDGIAHLEE
jgi:hypothetical protein